MKDNNNANTQFDNPEDILALLQDFQEDDIKPNSSSSLDTTRNNTVENDEVNEHNDTMDDDLLALLDMITKQEDSESTVNNEILAFNEQSVELDDLTNDYNNDELLEFSKLWETEGDFTIEEAKKDEPIQKDSNKDVKNDIAPSEGSDIGDIFADVLSVMKHEQDEDFISLEDFDKLDIYNLGTDNIDSINGNQGNLDKEAKKKLIFSEKDDLEEISTDKSDRKSLFKKLLSKSSKEEKTSKESKKKVKKEKLVTEPNDSMEKLEEKKTAKKAKKKSTKKTNTKTATSKRKSSDKEEDVTYKKSVKKAVNKDKKKTVKVKKVNEAKELNIDSSVSEVDNSKPLSKRILVGIGVLVATIAVVVIVGSTFYSESINNKRATWNFEKGRYDEAYELMQGQKITIDNKEIHEKITTVMYVNYFYNSYSSLYQLEMYPEALDSLLQGLRNYDRNIDYAKELGIEDDMNLVRKKILKELNKKYDLSVKSAVNLSKVDDKLEYSKKVHTIVGKQK